MMDYYAALERLQTELTPLVDSENLALVQAQGRILAEPLRARFDSPAFDNSAMDGYALHDPDGTLSWFELVGRSAAGDAPAAALMPGQARRIFTGAVVPVGATAVLAQEQAVLEGDVLKLAAPLAAGSNIRYRGEEFLAGVELAQAGQRVTPALMALAASQGVATLPLRRRLKVKVFSSGNELCDPGSLLAPGQIYDANRYQLLALLQAFPVEVIDGGILPDCADATRASLAAAAQQVDVILTSGGASVGEEDHLKAALQSLGTLDAWKLAIKPGKPFAWGRIGQARIFMLPGNPVATFTTFLLLVAPALRQLMGASPMRPAARRAQAGFSRSGHETRREFLRAQWAPGADGAQQVVLMSGQGSAMLSAVVKADVLVEIPPATRVQAGDWLTVYPLSSFSFAV